MSAITAPSIACKAPQVAVIGAGKVGSTVAQRITEKNLADVVLLDIVEGMPQGVALDLYEAQGLERHDKKITGTNDYDDTVGSDIVVITAGLPRKPGMSRDDLLYTNAKIVIHAAKEAIARSPNAIVIVVTNPLDVMTYLAWKATGLSRDHVMGMGGVLDSSRLRSFIALETGATTGDISTLVLGGHGDLMVPIPRYCTVSGVPISEFLEPEVIARLIERTKNGGAEIVKLLKTGSAFYAPASSVCYMVESLILNQSRLLPAAVYLDGQYGLNDLFLGVPCRLGCRGVEQVVEIELTDEELAQLHSSAAAVKEGIEKAIAKVDL
ncbi:malate dehydrogenase (NAD) [[Leptolyngbya] sp. PCC 7376]|uniref:malate dehydrogenase n=1 Tax=[Leptolyngbya] sp. PCC 7376 TaxID=111781 RepID=UPI00029EFE99|nr:malate dehydrogenase [[Leptolyngbya] sp. PCC 7376]AFY38443.1 malate dehydrogenase (NAD) [[Leptolyngbya] sp. PCC 7376]